ncbi:MAG: hypothetical protein PHG51_02070 [Candidatus Omnitrophica bacterium]|nr:hypothetical protein [Candidatus Omnitrophota bacterium]
MLKVRPEAYFAESQVKAVEKILAQTKTPQASAKFLKDRFQALSSKLYQREDRSIILLSEFARRLNIEIVSIVPQAKSPLLRENGEKIELSGRTLQAAAVSIRIKCFYKDLVRYLDMVDDNLPNFATVEKLKINRVAPKSPRLDIVLDINLYTLF